MFARPQSLDCSGMKLIAEVLDAVITGRYGTEPSTILVRTSCAMTYLGAVRY
jgi:hypothetical protein